MNKKLLTTQILLALAVSASVCTTGMAEEIGQITGSHTENNVNEDISVTNNNSTQASIYLMGKENVDVTLTTEESGDILLNSNGSGIRADWNDNKDVLSSGSVTLTSAGNNEISFDGNTSSEGNGIDANSEAAITLTAKGNNYIHSTAKEGDGVNAGANNSGTIKLDAGDSNILEVASDGIYTESGSTNDEEYIAGTGNNEITAGNNGIDHRGSGIIKLEAVKGGNIIHAGMQGEETIAGTGDGIRIEGDGVIEITGQYNVITAGDDGLYINKDSGTPAIITVTANGIDPETGISNTISGNRGIHAETGAVNVLGANSKIKGQFAGIDAFNGNVFIGQTTENLVPLEGTAVTLQSLSEDASYGIYRHGINSGNSAEDIVIGESDVMVVADQVNIYAEGKNNSSDPTVAGVRSEINNGTLQVIAGQGNLNIKASASLIGSGSGTVAGIYAENSANNYFSSQSDVQIISQFNGQGNSNGIYTSTVTGDSTVQVSGKDISIQSDTGIGSAFGIQTHYADNAVEGFKNHVILNATGDIQIMTNQTDSTASSGNSNGINVSGGTVQLTAEGTTTIQSNRSTDTVGAQGIYAASFDAAPYSSSAEITSTGDNIINAGNAIYTSGKKSEVNLTSKLGDNSLTTGSAGMVVYQGSKVQLYADSGYNTIYAQGTGIIAADYYGIGSQSYVLLDAKGNNISAKAYGLQVAANSDVIMQADAADNFIAVGRTVIDEETQETAARGISIDTASNVEMNAAQNNMIQAGDIEKVENFGDGEAVFAKENSTVTLNAGNMNQLLGAVYASGSDVTANTQTSVMLKGAANNVASAAVIVDAGDLSQDVSFAGKSVISALYAEGGAQITMNGAQNVIRTYADNTNENQLERTVWAYDGADIHIDGTTLISTDRYSTSPNSLDIAIAAGTATGLEDLGADAIQNFDGDRATVMLNYDGASAITGDILAAYAGQVDIAAKEGSHAGLAVTGNILAGNNGVLNLDLGEGGVLNGRADDYGDANEEHTKFFNPAFSSTILSGGEVSLKIGNGALWNVTGQSWITNLTGEGGVVNMTGTEDASSHAVHIKNLSGNHTFVMDVNHANHTASDMLYVANTDENSVQTVQFTNMANLAGIANGEKLRFATVNAANTQLQFVSGDTGTARTYARDIGINDLGLDIRNEAYQTTDTENVGYNGESFGMDKAGNESINGQYGEGTNWYLVRNESADQTSDAGKTVIAMSKVNYSNAVYMDRLNKRMGEARYIDGDDGLWVRLRHDRIGKDDAFRSMNTMFELGYDWHAKGQQDGEHRQGVAFDYMRGTADYQNVMGDGDVRRAGVWLYDTWLGDKGHYSDYVVKYGRLSNDFDIYGRSNGEKISGDYDNDVWSVSAEYGRKKDIGNEWYFEPQVQAQYAYVTSADYTTSQNTKVHLDGIDSLIGRAGFRLGRDTSEGNTVYFKADILHEFLGDQSIRAMDDTGVLSTTYENEGTWYDVGFGFSHKMGEDSYLFLDVEHSFGNDNDDTYQVNIGLNLAF